MTITTYRELHKEEFAILKHTDMQLRGRYYVTENDDKHMKALIEKGLMVSQSSPLAGKNGIVCYFTDAGDKLMIAYWKMMRGMTRFEKTIMNMNIADLFAQINNLHIDFVEDHAKALKGNKAAAQRTRSTSSKLAAALKLYRKKSMDL